MPTLPPRRLAPALAMALAIASGPLLAAPAEGEVLKVDPAAGRINLRHGEIGNLDMPPMRMAFSVKDPAMLGKVKAGDKVRFTADKINGAYTITSIEVVK